MTTPSLETKSITAEVAAQFDDFMRSFQTFRDTNDERLAQLEARGAADPLTTEKLARIERSLEGLTLKSQRPHLGLAMPSTAAQREHKAAFDTYVRKGESHGLAALEAKSLSVGSGPDGGYLVPPETESQVMIALKSVSPIRGIAGSRQVSGSVYKKPFSISGPGTGWVGETAARPETTSPTLAELSFPTMELYAMPAATSTLLDDSAVNIDEWLAEEVRDAFAIQEGTAFVTGNGVNKPRGFLDYTKVANTSWTWGNMGYLATGVAGAFPASNPADKLIDLIYTIKAGFRSNAVFVMNRATQSVIRKFKDGQGNYIWQPAVTPGTLPVLLGYPVIECEDVPSIGTDSYSVAFGDFRRGYLVVDRIGLRVLRDPYSSKPYVLFYTTKRVGGGVQDFDAIKLLKFGVS